MADEAFALSPISARPVMPSDADYDAIREAFMETSRGRWFLSEYAKRNRNADTHMVLDAVARIEQTLAVQRQASAESASESHAAMRALIGEAKAHVAKAIAALDDSVTLTAAHQGLRIIHEVAATLRECGADSRICDLLDQQVGAIDRGHRLVAGIDGDAILGTFDNMLARLGELSGHAGETARQPEPPPAPSAPAADVQSQQAAPVEADIPDARSPEASAATPAQPEAAITIVAAAEADELEFVEAIEDHAPQSDAAQQAELEAASAAMASEASAPQSDVAADGDAEQLLDAVVALDAEVAEDDAMLDLIAREMSAPDVSAPYQEPSPTLQPEEIEVDLAAIEGALRDEAAPAPMTSVAPVRDEVAAAPVMMETTAAADAPASIGAAVLASGMISPPPSARSDLLVPIRRMTQAEKIAFFS